MNLTRKAINFDLDTKLLKQYYPTKNKLFGYTKAYKDIKNFLKSQGFEHRQGSGYVSKEPLNDYGVIQVVNSLSQKFSWLSQCVKHFDVTEIGNTYDMTENIYDAANLKKTPVAKKEEKTHKKSNSSIPNYRKRIEDAQKNKDIAKNEKSKIKRKNEPNL